ncbi:MAG: AsmA-like C-terminal region-containing protein, partial [Actinomycetota bacterium]|nr:AsmA-like C-terminal region-containing protein [Actinomycetota bacterium]
MEVEQFSLTTAAGTASIIGQASLAGPTPGLSFALSLTQMPAGVMRAFWPPFVAAKTRGWFDINVKGGTLGPATLQVALPPDNIGARGRGKVLPDTALVGTVPFNAAEFTPIRTFPSIKNAMGGITFGNATASIWAQTGIVDVPGRGDLQAGGTTLVIPELGRSEPRGDLHLELAGSAAALAAVSNTPPLAIAAKKGILPEALSGEAQLSLDANIPIYESSFADVTPAFRLGLTNFSSTSPIDNRMITEANLVLEGSPKSYTVRGEGTLDGLEASVDLILGTAAPDTSAVAVTLDEEARKRLGFSFGDLVTGRVIASLTHTDRPVQQVALDLKESRISLPFLGWEKGPGVPATASFLMEKKATGTEITNFLLSGKGFEASGTLMFGVDGRLKTMELEKIALRPGDQMTVSAVADGSGYDVRVRGAALDARGILQGVRSGSVGGTADIFPIAINLDVEVVKGQNDVALSNVAGTLRITSKGLDAASLKGKTNENQSFEWTLGREGDTRVLRLLADGGGALIRFSGIYSRVAGGSLVLDYSGPVGGTGTGVAVMRDFRLLNEAALQPALSRNPMPREGLTQVPQTNPNDLNFTQLRIPFRQEGWVITIADAALRGAALGATANGTINIPGSKMAISGALIPVFGLNNVPGSIPLLGVFFGGRDEGLFGITYRLFGPLDEPQFSMNPISALAPGIFRKIFEHR